MDAAIKKARRALNRLPVQIMATLVALVIFTALAIGVIVLVVTRRELAALPVQALRTEVYLSWWIVAAMAAVAGLASGIGLLLARRINLPLERLRRAAVALRMGDVHTPIQTHTRVREISQVAAALEDARIALQHSLAELRREKDWSDHLLGSIVEGIVTVERSGRIAFFSPGAERITGWQAQAAQGQLLEDVLPPAEGEAGLSERLAGSSGKQVLYPAALARRRAVLSITAAPLGSGPTSGQALVLRDVTDEEALHRLLGNFLADITHEFRTPLSAQTAALELLIDQLPDLSLEEIRQLLDSLRLGALGLHTLVDNLLEGASIETGRFKVQPRPADIGQVIAEAARVMQPLYDKYECLLRVELEADLPLVCIDERRTGQALTNLLSNSVKWSPAGSTVLLRGCRTAGANRAAEAVRVAVLDQGPGVPAERRADLFTRFTHHSRGARSDAGAGIGLSVVKVIIEAQGGAIGMTERAGGGTEFWFTAPLAGAEEPGR